MNITITHNCGSTTSVSNIEDTVTSFYCDGCGAHISLMVGELVRS